MNVAQVLDQVRPLYKERPIMYFQDQAISFPSFYAEVCVWAHKLRLANVNPRDRVLLIAENKPTWMACYFAVLSHGAVLVPLNPALTAAEVAYIVDDCKPVLAFVDAELEEKLHEATHRAAVELLPTAGVVAQQLGSFDTCTSQLTCLDVGKDYPAIIFYTSGTTGRPKGAVLSHGSTWATQKRCATTMVSANSDDRLLIVGSFAFIMHSSIATLAHIAVGATIVVHERFRPEQALNAIAKHRITVLLWVPTMYVMAIEWAESHPTDLSSLRVCVSGGAVLPWPIAERFEQKFGKYLLNAWGMTEGTPITSFGAGERGRPESIGRAMPSCQVKVLDTTGNEVGVREIGELVFFSESNLLEYYNKPEATAETLRDGWVMSGDLGWRDEDGYFYLVGRKKDMIIRGGAKVYPVEVEEVINAHDDVAGCAVVGTPDNRFGESVVACVQPRQGRNIDKAALLDFCRSRLAGYKLPQQIIILHEFPLGPTGKVLKRILRERLLADTNVNSNSEAHV